MKTKYKILLPLFFCSYVVFGQWHKVHIGFSCGCSSGSYVAAFSIASNYNYFVALQCYMSGNGGPLAPFFCVIHTSDDGVSSKSVFGDFNACNSMVAITDSTFQLLEDGGSSFVSSYGVIHLPYSSGSIYPALNYSYILYQFTNSVKFSRVSAANKSDQATSGLSGINTSDNYGLFNYGLFFTSDSTGYFAANYTSPGGGFVKKTSDSTATWHDVLVDTAAIFYAVHFPDSNTGYVVGAKSVIYKTTNAGSTWTKLNTSNISGDLFCVNFINKDTGYAGGRKGVLYKTINGGNTWTTEVSNSIYDITYLKMVNDSIAYFLSDDLYKNSYYPTAIKQYHAVSTISVYPNPADNMVQVLTENSKVLEISLYDVLGAQIKNAELKITDDGAQLDLSHVNEGIYFVQVKTNAGVLTKKIIVQR